MGEVVVAVLNRPGEAEALLDAGTQILEIIGDGRLKALAVRMPPLRPSCHPRKCSPPAASFDPSRQENWAGQLRAVAESWSQTCATAGHPDGLGRHRR